MSIDSSKGRLRLGKLPLKDLRRLVFPHLPLRAEPGLDGGIFRLKGGAVAAHAPAIGVPIETLGFFAFHYSASNVAALFAKPRYLIAGIYLPPNSSEGELETIAEGVGSEAERYGVEIIAGHTATYKGLELPLISATCIGERIREPERVEAGDLIAIVGRVGGESLWLKALAEGRRDERWRRLTPLPALLRLQGVEGVKLLHDVSEGGVRGALHEIAETQNLRVEVESSGIPLEEGVEELGVDPLSAPSYGVLIAILSPEALDEASEICLKADQPLSIIGEIKAGRGAYIDGVEIEGFERTELDRLYGLIAGVDEITSTLRECLRRLEEEPEVAALIPEVGTNLVYARPGASSVEEVAGLSGRIVVSLGRPRVCGEVVYGGSRHLAQVILRAMRINPRIRAAINLRGGEDVAEALEEMGLRVRRLPPSEGACPIADYIESAEELHDAYIHPGGLGIEASTVILGENPRWIVDVVLRLARRLRDH